MTVIVYKNGIIAADSRGTISNGAAKAAVCRGCGTRHPLVDDTHIKIYTEFTGQMFNGEKIIAVSGTGIFRCVEAAVKAIRAGFDLLSSFDTLRTFDATDDAISMTLLVATTEHVYSVKPLLKETKVEKFKHTEHVVMGSGHDFAEFALKAFNVSAVQAINFAIFGDQYCGGVINTFDIRPNKPKEIVAYKHTPIADMRKLFADNNPFKTMEMVESNPKPKAEPKATPAVKSRTRKTTTK